jgi:hypothetical protein
MFPQSWPPLLSSGQISWRQIQRPGFDFRRYQIFGEIVGLEGGPLSLVSTIEELLFLIYEYIAFLQSTQDT